MPAHRRKDISGFRFGHLVVLHHVGRSSGNQLYRCVCDCGRENTFYYCNLTTGRSVSCGCQISAAIAKAKTRHGEIAKRKPSPEYKTWQGIKRRCTKQTGADYKYYGARGISVCEAWAQSFEEFLSDMGRRPSSQHSIDRINNDGNYEPGNCRWATRTEQNNNTRRNIKKKG